MPPFLAIFMSKEGAPITIGLYTHEEFIRRYEVSKNNTAWAILIDTKTSIVEVRRVNKPETEEKTI